jgi:hypothetical protein
MPLSDKNQLIHNLEKSKKKKCPVVDVYTTSPKNFGYCIDVKSSFKRKCSIIFDSASPQSLSDTMFYRFVTLTKI